MNQNLPFSTFFFLYDWTINSAQIVSVTLLSFSRLLSKLAAMESTFEPRIPLGLINIKRKYHCDKRVMFRGSHESLFRLIPLGGRGLKTQRTSQERMGNTLGESVWWPALAICLISFLNAIGDFRGWGSGIILISEMILGLREGQH